MTEWEQAADASPEFETEFQREVPSFLMVEYFSGKDELKETSVQQPLLWL